MASDKLADHPPFILLEIRYLNPGNATAKCTKQDKNQTTPLKVIVLDDLELKIFLEHT